LQQNKKKRIWYIAKTRDCIGLVKWEMML
jgi:hypothetical protein